MRIVHVLECFAGGAFEFLVSLTQELKQHEHIIVHGARPNTPDRYQQRFPADVIFIAWRSAQREICFLRDIKALIELVRILRGLGKEDYILHLHSSKAGFIGRVAACMLRRGSKTIYTAHGVSFLRMDISKMKKCVYVALERIAYCLAGKVVACSKSEADQFIRCGIVNVLTIHNGIKIRALPKIVNSGILTIGTIGRIDGSKNPVMFNQIAQNYLNDPAVRFLWIGDGDGELRNALSSPNIEVTGWLCQDDVREALRKIDIYLSVSLWEGLSLAVLEAMTMGKPLVLSDCVGNRDLVDHGQNGYVFHEIGEAMDYLDDLIEHGNLRALFGNKTYEKVSQDFSIEQMVKEYERTYKNMMK